MVLVELELAPVDPGAEAEVAADEEEDAGHDAGHDGRDVGARRFGGGVAAGRNNGVGDGGAVGARDGVGDGSARGEGAVGGDASGGGDGGAAGGVAADDALDGDGDLVAVGAAEAGGVLGLGDLLVLHVAARQGGEGVDPFELGGVEDVHARAVAADVLAHVAAHHDHLAVPEVAAVAGAGARDRLVALVDFDPGEGGDGEDVHVVVLDLLVGWDEVLAAEHVDVGAGAVGCGCSYGAWVYTNLWTGPCGGLFVP